MCDPLPWYGTVHLSSRHPDPLPFPPKLVSENLNSLISTYEVFIRIVVSDLLVATLLRCELMVAANAVASDVVNVAYGAPMQQWTQDAMYVRRVQELVLNQVNYYFSTENLCKDEFLRVHMDGEGWVPIPLLASFARLRRLTTDLAILTEAREPTACQLLHTTHHRHRQRVLCPQAMSYSPELEIKEGFTHVRKRVDWERWVLSTSKVLGRSTPVGEPSTGETTGDMQRNELQKWPQSGWLGGAGRGHTSITHGTG